MREEKSVVSMSW